MLTGEIRQVPLPPAMKLQSLASPSPVEELRRVISTLLRPWSSSAVPEKLIGLPGSAMTVGAEKGGVISTGWAIATVGATTLESMRQSRVALRRSA